MNSSLLEELQSKFKCSKCGKCCSVGGDMELSFYDVVGIELCLDLSVDESESIFSYERIDSRDVYHIKSQRPCHFLDKFNKTCIVQGSKPDACHNYPFKLYSQGGCNLDAVLTCPIAVKMLEDHLKGVE